VIVEFIVHFLAYGLNTFHAGTLTHFACWLETAWDEEQQQGPCRPIETDPLHGGNKSICQFREIVAENQAYRQFICIRRKGRRYSPEEGLFSLN
jgi:hypothetical protein